MKAAVWTDYGKMEIREVPDPVIAPNEVLLKVHAAGVCTTDLEVYTGAFEYGKPPAVLGHEIAAEIVQLGSEVTDWKKGDRVVVETSIGCGRCRQCKSGNRHLCPNLTEIGFPPHSGGYAQYTKAPAQNLFRIPDNVTYDEAAIIEASVCPVGGLMRLGVRFGSTVAVFGVGPAGIAFIQGAKVLGAGKVIALARSRERLERARHFGADVLIDTREEDVVQRVLQETDGLGAELVCEAAGSKETIEEAFRIVRTSGRVILYGIPDRRADIHIPCMDIILRQLQVDGVVNNPFVWEPLLGLVSQGRYNLKDMVTCTLPLERISEAFARMQSRTDKPIKIVVHPWENAG